MWQSSDKTSDVKYDNIKAFKIRLTIFKPNVNSGNFTSNLHTYFCVTEDKVQSQKLQSPSQLINYFSSTFLNLGNWKKLQPMQN